MRITTRHASVMALSLCVWLGVPMRASDTDGQAYWPQWRGPFATGASDRADPPVEWSETKNVKWKVEIPGRGSASPVVWGDRIFVLTAVPKDADPAAAHQALGGVKPRGVHRYVVLADNRLNRGKVERENHRPLLSSVDGCHLLQHMNASQVRPSRLKSRTQRAGHVVLDVHQ